MTYLELRTFLDRWIRNSAISAFSQMRLNTVLNEIIDKVEAGGGGGGGSTDASDLTSGILDNARLDAVPQSKIVGLVSALAEKATQADITTAINAVIDASPGALNTLNELAAALGDDPNFATTITNLIAAKANTVDLATVATSGSYNDLSAKPTIPTQITDAAGITTGTFDVARIPDLAQSKITGLSTSLSGKVNTDGSKVLSDVNFSTAKDTKLTGIATGATANITDVASASLMDSKDAAAILAERTAAATVTGKTISGSSNTFSNIAQSSVTGLQTALDLKMPSYGNKVSMIGSSITLGNGTHTGVLEYRGNADPLAWASLLSDSKIFYHLNAGVGGNTTAQVLARLNTDIISIGTDWCIVEGGINDALQNIAFSTFKANIIAICVALKAAGIKVVLCSIAPSSDATAKTLIPKFNVFLNYYAYANEIPIVDFYSKLAIADGTGTLAAAYNSGDGTHPNSAGGKVLGQAIVDTMANLIGTWYPYLSIVQTNSQNLLPNGLNVDTNADGLADNYTKSGTGTTTVLTSDVGKAQRIVATDGTITTVYQASTTGWSVGDRMGFSCKVEGAPTSPSKINLYITFAGPFTSHYLLRDVDVAVEKHTLYYEFTVPASTTGLRAFISSSTGGTNADIRMSQVTLVNLTTLGVL